MSHACIDPELLLRHAPFLKALAQALRDDLIGADDLAQETWSRALEKAPKDAGAVPAVRGWLARIMRSVRREAHRSDERRRRREAAVAAAETTSDNDPASAAARLELVRRLAAAVVELAEPYRGVLLARYFDGHEPPEIARRHSAPLATVHTQLRRGRALLRERLLPREDPKTRAVLLAGLGAFAGVDAATAVATKVSAIWMFGRVTAAAIVVGLGAWGIGDWAWLPPHGADATVSPMLRGLTDPATVVDAKSAARVPAAARREIDATEIPRDDRLPVAAQVVFRESGAPAIGARVEWKELGSTRLERERLTTALYAAFRVWVSEDDDQRQRECENWLDSVDGAFRELGLTDDDGSIALPPFEDAAIRVTSGERRLVRRLSPTDPTPLRLELEAPAAFRIRVVDRHGTPAPDTSVVIESAGRRHVARHWRSRTGPDGTVAVAPRHVEQLHAWRAEQGTAEFAVTLGLAAANAPRVALDLAALPDEPLELVLPPVGRIRIELADVDGRPFTGCALVGLAPIDPERGRPAVDVDMACRIAEAGSTEFENVALNLELQATPIDQGRGHEAPWQELRGPTREGETVVATVRLGAPLPRLLGRVTRTDGTPVGEWSFRTRFSIASAPHLHRIVTDRDGRFELPLQRYDFETDDTSSLPVDVGWLTLAPLEATLLDPALAEAAIVLQLHPALLEPEAHDVGDLVLDSSEVVVGGRVVDADGAPVAGVSLAATTYCNEQWKTVAGLEATADASGQFVMVGRTRFSPLRLAVSARGFRTPDIVEFTPGTRDLVVVALPESTLSGRLLLDPGIPIDQLVVRPSESLQSLADVRELIRQGTAPFTLATDGRWRLIGLGEKRGTLEVGLGNGIAGHFAIEPLVRIDDVTSDQAGANDPRLATIDLRGRLRVIELAVTDAAGAPLAAVRIDAHPLAADGSLGARRTLLTDRHGRARLLAAAANYELTVSKAGYVEQRSPAVGIARSITLERAP